MTGPDKVWWKDGVVYQIYPASFKDSNGDGLGDIPGIISKMDHLQDLGVDIVWVSPMFESPQVDMGYDISNYEEVHRPYGTVQDMEVLIEACHSRNMRLILDLVINHTSDQHAWFKESRSSKDNPKRDWYIWKPPKYAADGTRMPPTNWRSHFSGSTWEYDELTGEYYLHLFASCQPDLNWENPEAREAIYDSSMRFWLDKGVDGFRIDCVNMYSKGSTFPDAPILNPTAAEQPAWMIYCNGPRMHEFMREMNEKVLDHYDAMTVGELPHTPETTDVLKYISAGDKQLNMVFQFDIVDIGQGLSYKYQFQEWALPVLKKTVTKWQTFIDGTDVSEPPYIGNTSRLIANRHSLTLVQAWTTSFIENHDQGRSVSRFGCDSPEHHATSAKMLAMMMCALTGTLFVYQGQEIGMVNIPEDWPIEEYQDVESLGFYKSVQRDTHDDPGALAYVKRSIQILGRDNARTPMQWDDSPHAGFTRGKGDPWMRVHDRYPEINVAKQQREPDSVLAFWKRMIRVRKEHRDLFVHGRFAPHDMDNEESFVFTKAFGGRKAVVALNFTSRDVTVDLPQEGKAKFLMGNYTGADPADSSPPSPRLRPWEGRIYLVR